MNEFKGTKGKWNVFMQSFGEDERSKDYMEISITFDSRFNDASVDPVANALLISKAPELLQQLEKLYNSIDSCVDLTPELLIETKLLIKQVTTI